MKSIITAAKEILGQLRDLAVKVSDEQYSADLDILMNNSIGKHFRHIIEFHDILLYGHSTGILEYDSRQHDQMYEKDRCKAISKLDDLLVRLGELKGNKELELSVSYDLHADLTEKVKSNLARELTYNVEHSIHHMAIIRNGLQNRFPDVEINPGFGYAYSTIKHLNR
jgi:hypothetical protein